MSSSPFVSKFLNVSKEPLENFVQAEFRDTRALYQKYKVLILQL